MSEPSASKPRPDPKKGAMLLIGLMLTGDDELSTYGARRVPADNVDDEHLRRLRDVLDALAATLVVGDEDIAERTRAWWEGLEAGGVLDRLAELSAPPVAGAPAAPEDPVAAAAPEAAASPAAAGRTVAAGAPVAEPTVVSRGVAAASADPGPNVAVPVSTASASTPLPAAAPPSRPPPGASPSAPAERGPPRPRLDAPAPARSAAPPSRAGAPVPRHARSPVDALTGMSAPSPSVEVAGEDDPAAMTMDGAVRSPFASAPTPFSSAPPSHRSSTPSAGVPAATPFDQPGPEAAPSASGAATEALGDGEADLAGMTLDGVKSPFAASVTPFAKAESATPAPSPPGEEEDLAGMTISSGMKSPFAAAATPFAAEEPAPSLPDTLAAVTVDQYAYLVVARRGADEGEGALRHYGLVPSDWPTLEAHWQTLLADDPELERHFDWYVQHYASPQGG